MTSHPIRVSLPHHLRAGPGWPGPGPCRTIKTINRIKQIERLQVWLPGLNVLVIFSRFLGHLNWTASGFYSEQELQSDENKKWMT